MPFPRFAWKSSITLAFQSAIFSETRSKTALFPCRCPQCLAPWRDMDRARSSLVNNPAEPVEHDPDELKSVPGTASHKGPRSLTPLRIPGFGTRIRYEGSHLGLPTNLWRGYAPVH